MKIVLAPDSFKESMSAARAITAMQQGVAAVLPDAQCVGVPMADGGEGTVDAVVDALAGDHVTVEVSDALGRPVPARYGFVAHRRLAVIEMAAAAGLERIAPGERDILRASTFGVGQLIRDALDRGALEFVIGLGGSATNDAGAGMLTALGGVLTDVAGAALPPGGAALAGVDRIDLDGLDPRLAGVRIQLACDVTAPLLGAGGASAVFGPQKGATPADVELLEAALAHFAETAGAAHAETPGAGAAGGLGFALLEFLGATARPGVELVAETVGLEQALQHAQWVFTGEGGVDAQTLMGKTPYGVARVAARAGARVAIFAGRVAPDAAVLLDHGVDEIIGITAEGTPLEQALRDGPAALARAAADFARRRLA
ncbi:glycerate kinase [Mycobacterium sp. WMMD1722]|uniref:glycerate kinase n=1 Tax=Mycobacterium sp. WMMD1722 TaxID=3404117 RepID=UPI003BF4FAC7